jgi:hypothetical protein
VGPLGETQALWGFSASAWTALFTLGLLIVSLFRRALRLLSGA